MQLLSLVLSIVALVVAVLAYRRTGGLRDVRRQIDTLSSRAEGAREVAADAIGKIEEVIRGRDKPQGPQGGPPGPSEPPSTSRREI